MTGERRARWLISSALLTFALLVVATAWPVTFDSLTAQQAIDAVTVLRQKEPVSTNDLRTLAARLEAPARTARGERLAAQSIVNLALADQLSLADPERLRALKVAQRSAEAQLERAPLDTHAWARLAYAAYQLYGPSDLTLTALQRSLETGPREYYPLWSRLRLGALLWAHLDGAQQALVMDQAAELLETGDGSWRLARFYVDQPEHIQAAFDARIDQLDTRPAFLLDLERERARRTRGT